MKKEIYDVFEVEGTCYPVPRKVSRWVATYPEALDGELSIVEDLPDFITELFDEDEFDAIMEHHDPEFDMSKPGQSHTTCGSWENDRVLHIVPFLLGFDDMGYARDWIKENGFTVGNKLEYLSY